ncbi:unnamed protein product [Allacma fusca]|uniref:Uncharacterized protein n=1 Tax=Allacma fusca TaxID=39272 RepID=A0A8J2PCS8_9HEXA|nr:unnamed protein product [Allacma fusca]
MASTSIIGNGVPTTATKEPIAATSTTLVREEFSGTPISFPVDLESIFVNQTPEVPHLELLVLPENNQSNCEFGVDATYTDLSTAFSQHSLQTGCGVTEILGAVNKLAIEQAYFQKVVVRHLANITSDLAEVVRMVSKNTDVYAWEKLIIPGVEIPINTPVEFHNLGQWLGAPESKLKFVRA